MKKNIDSIFTMVLAGVGYLLFCSAIPSLLATVLEDVVGGKANAHYAILSFGAGIVFVFALYKKYREKLELFHNVTVSGVLEALAVGLVLFLVINFFVSPFLGNIFTASEANYYESVKSMYETPIATFIQVVIIAPLMEELIFRGFLLKRELRWRSRAAAVLLVAFFFGLLHMSIVQGISAGAAGIILCLFYARRGSVGLSVLAHAFYNGLAYFLMLFFGGF